MKNTKSMAGMLLAAAALAVVSIPTEALAKKDPFGYAANQAAVNMWLQQQGAAAYNNGYYTAPYNLNYGYNTYGSYNAYNPYVNNLYGNNLYTDPGYYDDYNYNRGTSIGGLLQQLF